MPYCSYAVKCVCVFFLLLSGCTDTPDSIKTLKKAESLVVYEGLPHPQKERDLLEQELKREDLRTFNGFPFYTPGFPANPMQTRQLKKALCGGGLYYLSDGPPKDCGPFHPDFAVEWQDGEIIKQALFCFGCDEVQILSLGAVEAYDLSDTRALEEVFSEFAVKRPIR